MVTSTAQQGVGPSRVLVWEAKHDTHVYDASTDEALEASALAVLRRLVELHWITEPQTSPQDASWWTPGFAALTDEQIDATDWPEDIRESLKKARSKKWAGWQEHLDQHEEATRQWRILAKLFAGETPWRIRVKADESRWRSPITAWDLLQRRNGYEYETYRLVDLETA